MDEQENRLGVLVRMQREQLGMRPADLADLANIDRARIFRIEAGQKIPSPETLAALAPVLQLDLAVLYEAAGYPVPAPSLHYYLRGAYGMGDEQVAEAERYLRKIGAANGAGPEMGEDELPE
jgi:transcriptional regulator with XRE-family HTH domain